METNKTESMEACVTRVWFDKEHIFVQLQNGKNISAPIKQFPRLFNGTDEQRNQYELWNDGKWIHWESLDEDLSAEGFLQNQQQLISRS